MIQDEKISVIVPVYKAELYLDQCIQSIVDQTYRNLEIILVDDGSPDNSPVICDKWARKDSRIKVIHKANAGSGAARNTALELASGEFIGMVDSDDYIAPKMYEHLYRLMTPEVGLVECELVETTDSAFPFSDGTDSQCTTYTAEEAMTLHIADTCFRQTPPNKLYRKSAIGNARFPEGTRIDDEFFTYQVIGNANILKHSSSIMYVYRQQPQSQMHLAFSLPRLQTMDGKYNRLFYLADHFPNLVSFAKVNMWFTGLFMGQMSLFCMEQQERTKAFQKIHRLLSDFPLTNADLQTTPIKRRMWLTLAKYNFSLTCRLRNFLHIGK